MLFNNFVGNQIQASDSCVDTVWYKNNKGNYWSNWISPYINADGIVDNPYVISESGAVDRYPTTPIIWDPNVDPIPEFSSLFLLILLMIIVLAGTLILNKESLPLQARNIKLT